MNVRLTKHHGLGNDFLVTFHLDVDDVPAFARRICDRRRGIGADGLLVGEPADGYSARMDLYNADGSPAEISGNGIRCFAQALAARRGDLAPQRILTGAGDRVLRLAVTDDPDTIEVEVEMGDVTPIGEPDGWAGLECHPDRPVAHLSLGNPHSVVGVEDVTTVDLLDLGGRIPHVNLEIVEPGPETDAITMRVHERGAGVTEACGTGACAAAYAARSWGIVVPGERGVLVHMDGGTATVRFDPDSPARAVLSGPATLVATIDVQA